MKDSYTIHEIAALYGVGPDALRYYEKLGLLVTAKGEDKLEDTTSNVAKALGLEV